jgi:hypothetical protein
MPYEQDELQMLDTFKLIGGLDPETGTLGPFSGLEDAALPEDYAVFDAVTAVVEAGVLDSKTWPTQLFADETEFEVFLEMLAQYEVCYRLVDRWYQAFFALTGLDLQEGAVSGDELAHELRKEASRL